MTDKRKSCSFPRQEGDANFPPQLKSVGFQWSFREVEKYNMSCYSTQYIFGSINRNEWMCGWMSEKANQELSKQLGTVTAIKTVGVKAL